ncbi:MAG: hypothetical protein JWN27_4092 [Candidatus Eremiobacteraeota bacterium]|nr:hypothetical protein [Candidatus Eremiobacteraeota bacterium]
MLVKALIAGVFALCVFTSCGGTTAGGPGTGGGQGATAYCASALIPGDLISPAAGTTGVSTAVGSVSFSVADARMLAGSLTLYPTVGAPVQGGAITGTAANAAASVPLLQNQTTYRAQLAANIPGDLCNPRASILGTFTTGS